jgi:DNA-binding GntR family transcriptional regulator
VTEDVSRPGRRAVGEWALEQLYGDIFSGRLQAGAEVGEVELADRLQVSRSPIRDALRQLEFDGLVVPGARNGLRVVKSFGHQDIAELYDVRASLESLAFGRAAELRSDEDLAVLESIQHESEAVEQAVGTGRRGFDADIAFHREVCRIAAMPRLARTLDGILRETRALLRQLDTVGAYPGTPAEVKAALQDHRDLMAAIQARDPDRARQVLVQHLEDRRDALLASVRE